MKHTEPQFWYYALAYFLLGGGSLAIILNFFLGEKPDLAGLIMIWFGIIVLLRIKRSKPKEPPPDNIDIGNEGALNNRKEVKAWTLNEQKEDS